MAAMVATEAAVPPPPPTLLAVALPFPLPPLPPHSSQHSDAVVITFSPLLLPLYLRGIPNNSPIYFPPSHASALLPLPNVVLSLSTPFSTSESRTHDSFMLTLHHLCYLVLYLDSRPLWQAFPRPFLYLTIASWLFLADNLPTIKGNFQQLGI